MGKRLLRETNIRGAFHRALQIVMYRSWEENQSYRSDKYKKVIHTGQSVEQEKGEIITAASKVDVEGCKVKYSPVSFFPGWTVARGAPAKTEQDLEFFRKIEEEAQAAERKYGEKLRAKFGPRMPKPVEESKSREDAERIASELGGKVFRL